ncbi:MAG: hypothetical protein JW774_06365, partial [Candidatus Aureabacteria bacterium]|nr:hypothetical protein [Candidatus Auribacterota bacterium]
ALVFLNNDKEKEFEDKMKEVIQTCPEKKDEFEARAKTELDAYRERKATAMFSQGLKVLLDENPENYHKNKEVYEQTLRESVSLYPPKKEEFEKKGSEEFHSYQKRIAKKHFEKAIQWAGENNWEKSNAELHKCLEFESGDFQIYNELANNSWEMNQGAVSDEYVRYLEKSLELNPKQEKCWSDLYKAYNELQKTDQANDACARGLKYFPDSQELNNFSR